MFFIYLIIKRYFAFISEAFFERIKSFLCFQFTYYVVVLIEILCTNHLLGFNYIQGSILSLHLFSPFYKQHPLVYAGIYPQCTVFFAQEGVNQPTPISDTFEFHIERFSVIFLRIFAFKKRNQHQYSLFSERCLIFHIESIFKNQRQTWSFNFIGNQFFGQKR